MPELTRPVPFEEAISKLGDRTPIASSLRTEGWANVPVALRERSFFSAGVESARALQSAQNMLGDFLADARDDQGRLKTGSRQEFVAQAQDYMRANGVRTLPRGDPREGGLQDIQSAARLELVFDHNIGAAQEFGYWKQGMDPDVLDAFPAQRFIRVREVRVPRSFHEANRGEVRLKTDLDFWLSMNPDFGVPWGPWGWGSGMEGEDVGRPETEALGLIAPGTRPRPILRDFNNHLQASLKGLSEPKINWLQRVFGSLVERVGDSLRWRDRPQLEPPVATPLPESEPEPAPPPPTLSEREARRQRFGLKPVSAALEIPAGSFGRARRAPERVGETLALIDLVHDDGNLPKLPIIGKVRTPRALAEYAHYPNGAAVRIGVRPRGVWLESSLVHEIGHFLDHQVLGTKGSFASEFSSEFKAWRKAVRASKAHREIVASSIPLRAKRYLGETAELWARSYTQFIAETSRDPILLEQMQDMREDLWPFMQWRPDDFAPIAAEIRKIFQARNWLP